MIDDSPSFELSKGDFVYQADQELFLVVTGVNENSYEFAVHGWREIDESRLAEYFDGDTGQLYRQETVSKVVEDNKGEQTKERFEALKELFSKYEDGLSDEGAHERFKLDDTES